MTLFTCFSAEKAAVRAILAVGTLSSAGVPGFGPNRIPCLFGRYSFGEAGDVDAYAVSEAVLFDPARWTKTGTGTQIRYTAVSEGRRIIAAPRNISTVNPEIVSRNWHFVLSFPDSVSEAESNAFFNLFAERVAFFFSSAKTREALSFPAILDVP